MPKEETRLERFRKADAAQRLGYFEEYQGDVGWGVVKDLKTGEIFKCTYLVNGRVCKTNEAEMVARRKVRVLNRRLKQYMAANNIELITEPDNATTMVRKFEGGEK